VAQLLDTILSWAVALPFTVPVWLALAFHLYEQHLDIGLFDAHAGHGDTLLWLAPHTRPGVLRAAVIWYGLQMLWVLVWGSTIGRSCVGVRVAARTSRYRRAAILSREIVRLTPVLAAPVLWWALSHTDHLLARAGIVSLAGFAAMGLALFDACVVAINPLGRTFADRVAGTEVEDPNIC